MGGAAGGVVVVVVVAWVVVVVVPGLVVTGGGVVVGGLLGGGGSGVGEFEVVALDVGALVVVVDDVVPGEEVVVSVDGDDGTVEPLVSDDVVVDVSVPGATTTGSGIGGGGAPGGRVALASFASTLTVSSCHWVTSSSFC
jgi:hypothetical protein